MKNIASALVLLVVLAALAGCPAPVDNGPPPTTYAIGDTGPGGGIVFYISAGGLHGMEVAPLSTEWTTIQWSTDITTLLGVSGSAIGTGAANTDTIVTWLTAHGQTGKAAQLCRGLTFGGRSDWFLPSSDELQAIWWNLVSDHSADNSGRGKPYAGSLGGFSHDFYWTSTETANPWFCCLQSFGDGTRDFTSKASTIYTRAVRAF